LVFDPKIEKGSRVAYSIVMNSIGEEDSYFNTFKHFYQSGGIPLKLCLTDAGLEGESYSFGDLVIHLQREGAPRSTSPSNAASEPASDSPKIVEISPANGATDVTSSTAEIRVTFNMPMGDGAAWCGGGALFPTVPEGKKFTWSADKKTCTLPVKLRARWKYMLSFNSPSSQSFQSESGMPLEPVAYSFTTGK